MKRRRGYQRSQTGGERHGSPQTGGRGAGRVRIVSGRFGGRWLPVPDARGLRPTPERTRETLFNWLQQDVAGARVLDLFAGSGALGFEALSRGAGSVTLVERSRPVAAHLQAVARDLLGDDAPQAASIIHDDALRWLARQRDASPPSTCAPFDLVFCDPPFADGLGSRALAELPARLAPGALVYVEQDASEAAVWCEATYEVLRETRAGTSRGVLLSARA